MNSRFAIQPGLHYRGRVIILYVPDNVGCTPDMIGKNTRKITMKEGLVLLDEPIEK
jgi:hypothetical protein